MDTDMSVFMAPQVTWFQQAYAQIETPSTEAGWGVGLGRRGRVTSAVS